MDQLKVLHGSVPGVKKDGAGLNLLIANSSNEHLPEVVVLGLAIALVVIDPVIYRKVVATGSAGMHQIDDVYTANQTMLGATVLKLDHLDGL